MESSDQNKISVLVVVESRELSLDDLTLAIGAAPDGGHSVGDSKGRIDGTYGSSIWRRYLARDQPTTERLSTVIEEQEASFAESLRQVAHAGCDVVLVIVQEISVANPSLGTGLHLTAGALEWLSVAGAELVIDQYLMENE